MAHSNQLFEVSQKGLLLHNGRALIMEFAQVPGIWDLPGGRIVEGEGTEDSFRRELQEELGIDEIEVYDVIDYEAIYYQTSDDPVTRAILGIIRHIHLPQFEIKLSFEHVNYRWITADEIDNYEFIWPNMKRALRKAFETYGKQ